MHMPQAQLSYELRTQYQATEIIFHWHIMGAGRGEASAPALAGASAWLQLEQNQEHRNCKLQQQKPLLLAHTRTNGVMHVAELYLQDKHGAWNLAMT